jgi:hypothetical protein
MSFSNHPPLLPPARLLPNPRRGAVRQASAVWPGQCHEASTPQSHRLGEGQLAGPLPSPSWEELLGRR